MPAFKALQNRPKRACNLIVREELDTVQHPSRKVTAVFAGKQVVNLKSLDDDRRFKSIPWDKLSE